MPDRPKVEYGTINQHMVGKESNGKNFFLSFLLLFPANGILILFLSQKENYSSAELPSRKSFRSVEAIKGWLPSAWLCRLGLRTGMGFSWAKSEEKKEEKVMKHGGRKSTFSSSH